MQGAQVWFLVGELRSHMLWGSANNIYIYIYITHLIERKKVSILQCSAFFMVHLSHPYMTTGKTIALTRWTFVGKVMSLLFNMLSRLVIAFLPRSKHLLISWLQSPSTVILEPPPKKMNKFFTVSIVSPSFAMNWWDQMPWSLFFECWVLSQLFHSPLSLSSRDSLVLRFLP